LRLKLLGAARDACGSDTTAFLRISDREKTGTMNMAEFLRLCRRHGLPPSVLSNDEVSNIFGQLDQNADGLISHDELLRWLHNSGHHRSREATAAGGFGAITAGPRVSGLSSRPTPGRSAPARPRTPPAAIADFFPDDQAQVQILASSAPTAPLIHVSAPADSGNVGGRRNSREGAPLAVKPKRKSQMRKSQLDSTESPVGRTSAASPHVHVTDLGSNAANPTKRLSDQMGKVSTDGSEHWGGGDMHEKARGSFLGALLVPSNASNA
jgi:hypothetical protein